MTMTRILCCNSSSMREMICPVLRPKWLNSMTIKVSPAESYSCNSSMRRSDELNRPLGGGGGSDTIMTTSDQLNGGG